MAPSPPPPGKRSRGCGCPAAPRGEGGAESFPTSLGRRGPAGTGGAELLLRPRTKPGRASPTAPQTLAGPFELNPEPCGQSKEPGKWGAGGGQWAGESDRLSLDGAQSRGAFSCGGRGRAGLGKSGPPDGQKATAHPPPRGFPEPQATPSSSPPYLPGCPTHAQAEGHTLRRGSRGTGHCGHLGVSASN